MPSYYPRRRYNRYKKPYYKKRYNTTYKKAQYAYRGVRKLTVQKELKMFSLSDVQFSSSSINPDIVEVALVTPGVGIDQRVGNSINPTSIKCRMDITASGTAIAANKLRVIAFIWKGSNNPSFADIVDGSTGADMINSFKPNDARFSSKFLFDRTYSLNPLYPSKYVKFSCKIPKRYAISYSNNPSVPFQANGVYVFYVYEQISGEPITSVWNTSSDFRLFYKD